MKSVSVKLELEGIMRTDKKKTVKQEATAKKSNKASLPKEIKQLIIDTRKLKNQKSSTKILNEMRYGTH